MFGELDTRSLRSDIVAAGNDLEVSNRAESVPYSIINPSLLFDELQVKRVDASKDKLPEYPAPALKTTP
jgi:TldD protein